MSKRAIEDEIDDADEIDEADLVIIFSAFAAVRLSGVTNMIVANDVSLHVMNVLGLWQRPELAKLVNDSQKYSFLSAKWRENCEEKKEAWESLAAGMFYGKDYVAALERFPENISKELTKYKSFYDFHCGGENSQGNNWAEALIEKAKRVSLKAGLFARDKVKLECLRGQFNDVVLMKTAAMNGLMKQIVLDETRGSERAKKMVRIANIE